MCALAAKAAPLRGSSRDPARLRRAYRTTIDRSLARVAVVVRRVCCLITSPRETCWPGKAAGRNRHKVDGRRPRCNLQQQLGSGVSWTRVSSSSRPSSSPAAGQAKKHGGPRRKHGSRANGAHVAWHTLAAPTRAAGADYRGACTPGCVGLVPRDAGRERASQVRSASAFASSFACASVSRLRLAFVSIFASRLRRASDSRLHPSSAGLIWHRWPC